MLCTCAPHATQGRRRPWCKMMNALRGRADTWTEGPVDGLDRPCSRNPTAALPLVGSDPYVPCTPSGERGATGLGESVRLKNGVAEMVSSVRRTVHGPVCAPHTCPVHCGHGFLEFTLSQIRVKCKMNALSRGRPTQVLPRYGTSRIVQSFTYGQKRTLSHTITPPMDVLVHCHTRT